MESLDFVVPPGLTAFSDVSERLSFIFCCATIFPAKIIKWELNRNENIEIRSRSSKTQFRLIGFSEKISKDQGRQPDGWLKSGKQWIGHWVIADTTRAYVYRSSQMQCSSSPASPEKHKTKKQKGLQCFGSDRQLLQSIGPRKSQVLRGWNYPYSKSTTKTNQSFKSRWARTTPIACYRATGL